MGGCALLHSPATSRLRGASATLALSGLQYPDKLALRAYPSPDLRRTINLLGTCAE
jgi:hypothetical protein